MESQLINSSYENFRNDLPGKKCVLFGAGKTTDKILKDLDSDIKVDYIIDNDFWRWGTEFRGIPIYGPAQLTQEDKDKLLVIIAFRDILLAEHILRDWGVKHYYAYGLFFERIVERYENINIHLSAPISSNKNV